MLPTWLIAAKHVAQHCCSFHLSCRCLTCRQTDDPEADHSAGAFDFITGLLVENRATAGGQATLKVLRHLADKPGSQSEASFVAVLQTAGLQGTLLQSEQLHLCLMCELEV